MPRRAISDEILRMVAHLAIAQCRLDRCDDFVAAFHERMLPVARSGLGYRGVYLLVDRQADAVLVLSLWDKVEDAQAYEESAAYRNQLLALDEWLAEAVRTRVYEVGAQA